MLVAMTLLLMFGVTVQSFPLTSQMTTRSTPPGRTENVLTVCKAIAQEDKDESSITNNKPAAPSQSRRQVFTTIASSLVVASTVSQAPKPAKAATYSRTFPVDLDFENNDTTKDLTALREAKIRQQKASTKKSMDYVSADPLTFRGPKDVLTSATWGGALWLLSGSRSNPLVTPLANALYDPTEEEWLQDRNESLFAPVPPYLYFVLSCAFFFLGIVTDRILLLATEGDANVSLQLAGVSLITGGSLELGRIFSGEKQLTRKELDRTMELEREFTEFAENRLMPGGNCHRSEVVKAFRRYYAKVGVVLNVMLLCAC